MSPPKQRTLSFALISLCFFGSGMTGLIYEILWTYRLQLTYGSTTLSVTTVLAAFMAGLGLGSYIIGRLVDKNRHLGGVRIYAYLELGLGVYALLSLPLLALIEKLYAVIQSSLQLGPAGATLIKLALCFPVLAFPAGLMGGTLPALVQGLIRHRSGLHSLVGRLYGINTAGAAVGTALAGMVMIELLGLGRSMALAACINLTIAIVVLSKLGRYSPRDSTAPQADADSPDVSAVEVRLRAHLRSMPILFCSVAVILTGLLSMLYEVVWTRLLSLVIGSSTYAFTIVLTIFLIGIALGAMIYARVTRNRPPTPYGLTLLLLGLSLWVSLSIVAIPSLPGLLANLSQVPGITFWRVLIFEIFLAGFILLIPTLLLGAALPMAMGIVSRALGQVGRDVGGVYLANTAGAIAGSILTGFLFIPLFGTQNTLLGGLTANLVLVAFGILAFGVTRRRRITGLALVALVSLVAVLQPAWPALVYDSGLGYRLDSLPAANALHLETNLHRHPSRLLFLDEGRDATISVRLFRKGTTLLINGKPDASTSEDMTTQVVLGVVTMLVHPRPVDVGIVGWGSGVTAYTATFFDEIQQIDVVEIEEAVVRTSPFFHSINGKIEQNPKVKVIIDDARSHFLTTNRSYDVIISEPSNPWMAGVSGLFSLDYFKQAQKRLKPGGIYGQWLQLYRLQGSTVAMIFRTMLEAFPHVQLWFSDSHNLLLLGSDRPIRPAYGRVQRAYRESPLLRLHMEAYGPGGQPEHFFGSYLLDRQGLIRIVERFEPETMTDDRPLLEYQAVRNIYAGAHDHMGRILQAKADLGQMLPPTDGPPPPVALALAGGTRILRRIPSVQERASARFMKAYPQEPQIRLARAQALLAAKKLHVAQQVLAKLPSNPPDLVADAALVAGRVMLAQGRAGDAFAEFEKMGGFRPTARLWYQFQAALDGRKLELAWDIVEQLMPRLDQPWDPDARRIKRYVVYAKISDLIAKSRQFERGIRLLTLREESADGELDRVLALAAAYHGAQRPQDAARTLDQMLECGLSSVRSLELCEEVYGAVKEHHKAEACRAMRYRARRLSDSKQLWGK